MTRVFLSVGERDGVRRGDLVGAIAGEAGITGAQIGRIELRESHAVVEVASDVAARVIEKMNGTNIRGRRVAAREDRESETRGARPVRSPRGDRGDRVERGGGARRDFTKARGPRGPSRSGPSRSGPSRSSPSRSAPRDDSGPRAARESREWTERAERLRHARRGPAGPRRDPATGED